MSELRDPNESRAYRDARDALLKDEQERVEKTKALAEKRRRLPRGGEPEARPDRDTPPQDFKSEFLEKNFINKK